MRGSELKYAPRTDSVRRGLPPLKALVQCRPVVVANTAPSVEKKLWYTRGKYRPSAMRRRT